MGRNDAMEYVMANRRTPPKLALVVPCHNEAEIIARTMQTLDDNLAEWNRAGLVAANSYCCFVDDGSDDDTWRLLAEDGGRHCRVKLTHNVGYQNALFAGLSRVADRVDCCVSLDADLQDDLDVIPDMLRHFAAGADVVYGVREARDSDGFFKRNSAALFYWVANNLGVGGIPNHADFRLMSRRCLLALREFRENHLYLRGVVPSLKLPSAIVYYRRRERIGGATKFTLAKLLALAFNGITSFSVMPLRIITAIGVLMAFLSLLFGLYTIYGRYTHGNVVDGWTSLIVSLYFLSGLLMFSLGIIGEYIGKTFIEAKKRPLFLTEEIIPEDDAPAGEK